MIRHLAMTGLGLGYAPVASGTFGSAGAMAIAIIVWALATVVAVDAAVLDGIWILLTLLAIAGCAAWGPWAIEKFADRARKPGDPGHVVLDEFAGQWVALVAMPLPGFDRPITVLAIFALQFFLFRLFDVLKPPPSRQFEKLPAGWGIVMDDVAAGIYANLIGQVIVRLML